MNSLFDVLVGYLEREEHDFEVIDGRTTARCGLQLRSGYVVVYADVRELERQVLIYSLLPTTVPEERRTVVAEFLTRANYGLVLGNFEMDFDDGEVRYKTSADVEGGELSEVMLETLFRVNVSTMDRYFRGIMAMIYSDRSAAEVLEEIERPKRTSGEAN
jgi:hypothetical protein